MLTFQRPAEFQEDYFTSFEDQRSNYDLPVPEQINGAIRFYLTPDGEKYPSMSSVLSILSKDFLVQWRARVGVDEAEAIGRRARTRGTAVHALSEHYIKGDREQFSVGFRRAMPDTQANFPGIKRHLDEHLTAYRAIECPLFSRILRVAGTTDLIGTYDGRLSIIDFKTSGKVKKREYIDSYFMQCDGYGQMWSEMTGEVPEQCVIIMATDNLKDPQVFIEPWGQSIKELKQTRLAFYKEHGH